MAEAGRSGDRGVGVWQGTESGFCKARIPELRGHHGRNGNSVGFHVVQVESQSGGFFFHKRSISEGCLEGKQQPPSHSVSTVSIIAAGSPGPAPPGRPAQQGEVGFEAVPPQSWEILSALAARVSLQLSGCDPGAESALTVHSQAGKSGYLTSSSGEGGTDIPRGLGGPACSWVLSRAPFQGWKRPIFQTKAGVGVRVGEVGCTSTGSEAGVFLVFNFYFC